MVLRQEVFNVLTCVLNDYDYCILRNYENLPQYNNDIDILINGEQLNKFIINLSAEFKKIFIKYLFSVQFSCLSIYFYDEITENLIHIDLFVDIKWKVFEYLSASEILANRKRYKDIFIPSEFHEMYELTLTRLIYQAKIKDSYKNRIILLYNKIDSTYINRYDKYQICSNIISENWNQIEKKVNILRMKVIGQNILKPVTTIRNLFLFFRRIALRIFNPPGLFLAIYGVDGSGKTTQVLKIIDELKGIYSEKFKIYHFRPTLFYKEPKNITFSNPHNQRKSNSLRSISKLVYYVFIYNWGYFTQMLPILAKNGLIIFDRYYYDLVIDPIRYRIPEKYLFKYINNLIPKTHLNICLIGNPAIIFGRKQEISKNEIEKQQNIMTNLEFKSKTYFINTSNNIDGITNEIKKIIMNHLINKNA